MSWVTRSIRLSHSGVDRTAPLLPFRAPEGVGKVSPVEASRRYLEHLREAWDSKMPDTPFAEQQVLVTVPASFDAVARELTLEAAQQAGYQNITLLEEPQAAFYAWIERHPDWRETLFISREFVFYTATLTGVGIYLLAMAIGGYVVRDFGGAWGPAIQVAYLVAAMSVLVFCASDYVGAWGGIELFRRRGIKVDVVAGSVTDSKMGEDYIEKEFGVPAANARRNGAKLFDVVRTACGSGRLATAME